MSVGRRCTGDGADSGGSGDVEKGRAKRCCPVGESRALSAMTPARWRQIWVGRERQEGNFEKKNRITVLSVRKGIFFFHFTFKLKSQKQSCRNLLVNFKLDPWSTDIFINDFAKRRDHRRSQLTRMRT